MVNDVFGFGSLHDNNEVDSFLEDPSNNNKGLGERMDKAFAKFYELLNNGNQELYEKCMH